MAPRFVTKPVMKPKFRLFRRGKTFWCEDTEGGRQQSLGTKNKGDATRLLRPWKSARSRPTSTCERFGPGTGRPSSCSGPVPWASKRCRSIPTATRGRNAPADAVTPSASLRKPSDTTARRSTGPMPAKPRWWCRPSPPTNRNRRPTSAAKSVSRAQCSPSQKYVPRPRPRSSPRLEVTGGRLEESCEVAMGVETSEDSDAGSASESVAQLTGLSFKLFRGGTLQLREVLQLPANGRQFR